MNRRDAEEIADTIIVVFACIVLVLMYMGVLG